MNTKTLDELNRKWDYWAMNGHPEGYITSAELIIVASVNATLMGKTKAAIELDELKQTSYRLTQKLAQAQLELAKAQEVIFSGTHKARADYLAKHSWVEAHPEMKND